MHGSDLAAAFALGAALLIAAGDVFQQRSAHEVTDAPVGHVALMLRLLVNKQWWLGSLLATAGFGLQAAALGLGSVVLVQALLATSVVFALPLSARYAGRRITGRQWLWALVLAAAVSVIVTVGEPTEGQSRGSLRTWALVIGCLGPAIALCLLIARLRTGRPVAAVLLGAVSGSLWGVFAVLTKGLVDQLDQGIVALLTTPELYGWVLVAITATTLQQSAFRAGSMSASLPAVSASEPLVGSVLGIVVLGEALRPGESGSIGLALAVVAMLAAIVALARSEAATTVGAATVQPNRSPR
jgi:drug/metabolite transporter (DMT)-like permease